MALKVFILENNESEKKRREDIQNAVAKYLDSDSVKVVYDQNGKPSLEGSPKKLFISITCAHKVMLAVLYEKHIGIDGEYLPRIMDPNNKIDYTMLAERFFTVDESEFLRESAKEQEIENFVKIWVRKEAYVKAANKTLADFPNFSVVDNTRFLPKIGNISLKKFAIKFDGCEDYLFVIAGVD